MKKRHVIDKQEVDDGKRGMNAITRDLVTEIRVLCMTFRRLQSTLSFPLGCVLRMDSSVIFFISSFDLF